MVKFIFYSIVLSLALLLVYEGFLRILPTGWAVGQNQLQRNIIAAEQFTIASQKADVVLVGSSLSSRIGDYYQLSSPLPPTWRTLSFGGGSVFDGIRIFELMDYYPDTILIEANFSRMLSYNVAVLDAAFGAPRYPLKRHILSLQTQHQPSNVLPQLLYTLLRGGNDGFLKGGAMVHAETKNEVAFQKSIQYLIAERKYRTDTLLQKYFTALEPQITTLRHHKCVVIMYFLPVDPLLEAASAHLHEADFIRQFAAKHRLPLINLASEQVTTTDGLHLDKASAEKIRSLLIQQFKAL